MRTDCFAQPNEQAPEQQEPVTKAIAYNWNNYDGGEYIHD